MYDDAENSGADANRAAGAGADSAAADPGTLHASLAAQKDQYLRLVADFQNFRKRTQRDSTQQAAAEKDAFIHDLLPVVDNLERALAAEPMNRGVAMALQQLGQLLHRHGIEAADDAGQPFDAHRQEAVFVRHDLTQPDQGVLEVSERGYCRGDQVFRVAKVIVNDLAHSPGAGNAR
ncbi:MAG: nucleotide exchange factor GrpE [Lentisphaerae bacterium RIFOXYB12_FULL_65_16]|nr:MAG: nucleotide exchange factor GrpE [Lentisphaerae bacterium RIFOXYA12_64_32]OGV92262.1 MAG: nucleotide exchange factor GrpE [Lentisphaerae bacterium RIFOXYB12_FULL_65_16]